MNITLELWFKDVTSKYAIVLQHPVSSCHTFSQQVTSPKQVTLGTSILGLSLIQASYPPQRRNSLSTSSFRDSRDGSRRLERKHCFSLATPIAKLFTFVWLLWKDKFAKHLLINRKLQARTSPTFLVFLLLINRSHKPDTPTKFLVCYFCCKPFLVSLRILLSSPFKF